MGVGALSIRVDSIRVDSIAHRSSIVRRHSQLRFHVPVFFSQVLPSIDDPDPVRLVSNVVAAAAEEAIDQVGNQVGGSGAVVGIILADRIFLSDYLCSLASGHRTDVRAQKGAGCSFG